MGDDANNNKGISALQLEVVIKRLIIRWYDSNLYSTYR